MNDDCKRELNQNGELKYVLGFKYSYSTLMRFTKTDLIELLNIAQHNYEVAQSRIFNVTKYAEKLNKALDRACDMLVNPKGCPIDNLKMDNNGEIDCNFENQDCKKCWIKYFDEIYLIGDLKK